MLEDVQNDLLSLTFDTQGLQFLNLGWDIAAVGIDQPGGLPSTPTFLDEQEATKFRLTLYDTPGGVFNINSLGLYSVLDTVDVTGTTPLPGGLTFLWNSRIASLNAGGSTDHNVTLLIDLIGGGYGSFDNLVIASSNEEGELPNPVPEPASLLLLAGGLAAASSKLRK